MTATPILALGGMGGMEMILVAGVILLLFGAKKLPELARGLGQGIREFKKASNEVTEEIHRAGEDTPPSHPVSSSRMLTETSVTTAEPIKTVPQSQTHQS